MELREILKYPERNIEKEKVLETLLYQMNEEDGEDKARPILEEIRKHLPQGRSLCWEDAVSYLGWTDAATLARDLALPEAPAVPDITREETLYLVSRILENPADETVGYYLELLDRSFPAISVSELIFNPELCDDYMGEGEPTAQEIVEIAFRSRLHILTQGDENGK